MYRLVVWGQNLTIAGGADNLAAIPDESNNTFGDFIRVPADTRFLVGEYAHIEATDPTRVVIASPSLRALSNQDVSLIAASDAGNNDQRFQLHQMSPREFLVNEDVEVLVTAADVGNTDNWVGMMLADGPLQPVNGNMFTTRLTAAVAQAQFAWNNGVLTFIERLPVRDYDVVGMRVEAASGTFARLIFPGTSVRPGVNVVNDFDDASIMNTRYGALGVIGRYNQNQPPQLEVLGGAATAQTVWLDLIPV